MSFVTVLCILFVVLVTLAIGLLSFVIALILAKPVERPLDESSEDALQ